MIDLQDDRESRQDSFEAPDATRYPSEPFRSYEPHPLFPRDDNGPEYRDIQIIAFRRRRSDGRIDNTAEDVAADEITSWAQVIERWGGGEYKAIGKDKNHRVVAWYPEKNAEWLLFAGESKPFTVRGQRYLYSPPMDASAVAAAPLAPPLLEATMTELIRELRASRAPSPTDLALVEMIKAQGELLRTVLNAVLPQRPVEPIAQALHLLSAMREWAPKPHAKASVADRRSARLGLAAARRRAVRVRRTRP